MKKLKKGLALLLSVLCVLGMLPITAAAELVDTSGNEFVEVSSVPTGKVGKTMTVKFMIRAKDYNLNNVVVNLAKYDSEIKQDYDNEGNLEVTRDLPFETTNTSYNEKKVGNILKGYSKSVSFSLKVRRDIKEGYYGIPFYINSDEVKDKLEYVNVWIGPAGSGSESEDKKGSIEFMLGEGQETPYGTYPNVMDFSVNVRNSSSITAQDVNVSMVLNKDTAEFPFDINEANYDKQFERIGANETVPVSYSMAIRKDAYSGYYPLKFEITYKDSSEGEVQKAEEVFYVHIKNKEKDEGGLGDFNANDREKARIIVDSFETIPKEIIAGSEFELILRMKNASAKVPASNILFSLESEKVSESAVFSTESGSSSMVVNELGAGATTEVRFKLLSKAGVDQRSYSITIKEKYDSPEFKNAEESVSIDIPVKQIARLNTGTIEVMPASIGVGAESNVMFGINNTGRVQLYNVMALFEADSIQTTDAYVGNIKPGETGNVDVMISGMTPTTDDGKVKITISYEDENGVVNTTEKEMSLFVTEAMDMGVDNSMAGNIQDVPIEESIFQKYKVYIMIAGAAVAVVGIIAIVLIRKKKKAAGEEGMDDEIS